jgi:RNA polymerase sigma factor (TIGR02999 family)
MVGADAIIERISNSSKVLPMSEVTRILGQVERGDSHATDELLPLVYDELRQLAGQRLANESPGHTLQATALVHDVYLRLVGVDNLQQWENRSHFFAAAAEAMRRILVEQARRKQTQRHGGLAKRVELDHVEPAAKCRDEDLLALDEALERLEQLDKVKAELVKLRYFAGLTIPQAANALGVSVTTANRYWTYARAWLHEALRSDREGDGR